MRAFLAIAHIIVAYLLLRGWPASLPMWVKAALALIVILIALPIREKRNPNNKRSLLTCLRKPHWMDFFYIGSVIIIIQILLLSILTLFPMEAQSMAETLDEKVTLTPQPKKNDAPSEL